MFLLPLALAALTASGPGCAPRRAEEPLLVACRAPGAVVLDGIREEKEWAASVHGGYVECGTKRERRYRHYVRAMFDDEFLYLAVDTSHHESFKTERGYALGGAEPVDGFPLAFRSEDQHVFRVYILSGGFATCLECCKVLSTREEATEFVLRNFGLRTAAVVNRDPRSRPGSYRWTSEIQVPLRKLLALGRHVWVELSGMRFRLAFEQ
jgi:hypothetical protein